MTDIPAIPATKVCTNKDCEYLGQAQTIENFIRQHRQCRACIYKKNRKRWKERGYSPYSNVSDDSDIDYTDMYPLYERSFGFRSWAVITSTEYAKELTPWQIADTMEGDKENLKK